jgi:acyl carrier protein
MSPQPGGAPILVRWHRGGEAGEGSVRMDDESVGKRCIAIIAKSKLIPEESVTRDKTFEELQIDSLDKINISFEIEDTFNIQIPDDSISSLRTVGDIIDGVLRLQHEATGQSVTSQL